MIPHVQDGGGPASGAGQVLKILCCFQEAMGVPPPGAFSGTDLTAQFLWKNGDGEDGHCGNRSSLVRRECPKTPKRAATKGLDMLQDSYLTWMGQPCPM